MPEVIRNSVPDSRGYAPAVNYKLNAAFGHFALAGK